MKNSNLLNRLLSYSHEKQTPQRFGRYAVMLILFLTCATHAWADHGYNGQSFVYLQTNNGTTYYYQVSSASWDVTASLPDSWGGVLKDQTINNVQYLKLKGGAVGGWTGYGDALSGTLYYKVTNNTTTPTDGWTSLGSINASNVYQSNSDHCYYYKNNYSTDITPHTPGTYYLHIKITDGDSNDRTSYVKIVVPPFTVAGSTAVLGSNWAFDDTDNDMSWSTGTTYTLTKSNVTLSTGTTYECKVGINHGSSEAYPASNKQFTVDANGHYNVTFSFDASSHDVGVSTTRLYAITPQAKYTTSPNGASYTTGTTGGTVTINSSSSATYVANGSTYTISATPAAGYIVESVDVGSTNIYSNTSRTSGTYNNSSQTASADATVTVKFARVKNITVYIYTGTENSVDVTTSSVVMNGCVQYVGATSLTSMTVNNHTAGSPKFTLSGNWLSYTFTNVSQVSNITCARSGANVFTGTITDNVYYMYDGTELSGQCVPRANPTWGTAPASGAIGGSMTATVSGAPDGATITWSSTATSYATVNSSGVISYVAAGSATIKARVQKAASGDYCALDYTLSQDITVTSGATVSATRTCPEYVSTAARQVSLHITFTGTSSGWVYCIKHGWDAGYEVQWVDASGSSADWTKEGGVGTGEYSFIVELYDRAHGTLIASSSPVTVIGEISEYTNVVAGSNGSVSPSGQVWANTNHVHPTITATPDDHYHFVNWTSSNNTYTWVSDPSSASSTLYASASNYTITANFAGDQYSITYKDQGGGAFSGTQTSAPTTHTYGTATTLKIPTKTGYNFGGWFTASDCSTGAVGNTTSASLGATAYTDDITLYAKWIEVMSDLTTSCSYDAGDPSYSAPTVSNSATTIGYTTSRTITAASASTGYVFAGWTITNGTRTDGGGATANPITVRSNGDGEDVSVVANYNEVLTQSTWVIKGGSAFGGTAWSTEHALAKKTGHSTESVVYHTFSIASVNNTADVGNNNFNFKVVKKGASDTYYGLGSGDGQWWYFRNTDPAEQTMGTSNKDIQIRADVVGDYEVKVDYSDASNPTVTITFPTSYTLTYAIGDVKGNKNATSISSSPTTASGSQVISGGTVTLTAPDEATGYTWKGWYLNSDGSGVQQCSTKAYAITMDDDVEVYACYTENSYSTNVAVLPASSGSISSPTPSDGKINVLHHTGTSVTASPNTNYIFDYWSYADGGLSILTSTTTSPATFKASSAGGTITAHFADQWAIGIFGGSPTWKGLPLKSGTVYEESYELAKGDHAFKVVDRKGNTYYTAGSVNVTRADNEVTASTEGGTGNNMTLKADVAGTYTFTFNTDSKALEIGFPEAYAVNYSAIRLNGSGTAWSGAPSAQTSASLAVANGDMVLDGSTVTFTAQAPNTGYTFEGWYSTSTPTIGTTVPLSSDDDADDNKYTYTTTLSDAGVAVYAIYTEDMHTVTVTADSHGNVTTPASGTPRTVQAGISTAPAIAAEAVYGYYFKEWTVESGTASFGNKDNASTTVNATEDATILANFVSHWTIAGGDTDESDGADAMGDWSTVANSIEHFEEISSGVWQGYVDINLPANSTFKFKVRDLYDGSAWYGNTGTMTYGNSSNWLMTTDAGKNCGITTAGKGSYRFTWNETNKTLTVGYPTSWTVAYGVRTSYNGGATSDATTTGGSITSVKDGDNIDLVSGKYVVGGGSVTVVAAPASGYEIAGWYSDAACTSAYTSGEGGVTISGEGNTNFTITDLAANTGIYVKFAEKMTTVNFASTHGHVEISSTEETSANVGVHTKYTLTPKADWGYYFAGWEKTAGTEYAITGAVDDEDNTAPTLSGNGNTVTSGQTLTAKFVELEKVYLYNMGWGETLDHLWPTNGDNHIYAYFAVQEQDNCPKSANTDDPYYIQQMATEDIVTMYAYVPRGVTRNLTDGNDANNGDNERIAFSNHQFTKNYKFYQYEAIYWGSYRQIINEFVPQVNDYKTLNSTKVYNGYWKKHDPKIGDEAGYYLKHRTASNTYGDFTNGTDPIFKYISDNMIQCKLRIDNGDDANNYYMIHSAGGVKYTTAEWPQDAEAPTVTTANCKNIGLTENQLNDSRFLIKQTSQGYYTLTMTFSSDTMYLKVDYPVAVGDYRLEHSYTVDAVTKKTYSGTLKHDDDDKASFTSMYLNMDAGTKSLKMQTCTSISGTGHPVWSSGVDVTGFNTTNFKDGKGVYRFRISWVGNDAGEDVSSATPDIIALYDGEYYIKTDYALGGWTNYIMNDMEKNTINFTKSDPKTFDYYYAAWVSSETGDRNVKCVVGNIYNEALCDTLVGDEVLGEVWDETEKKNVPRQYLAYDASVRFSYNSYTNELKRAYLNGSNDGTTDYMYLQGTSGANSRILDYSTGSTFTDNKVKFKDRGNWIYEIDIKAEEGARVRLISNYRFSDADHLQYYKGSSGDWSNSTTEQILGGSNNTTNHPIRIVYDFKTNHLISAWLAGGEEGATRAINTNAMIIREHQEQANQITFSNSSYKLTDVDTVYSVMKFNKWTINNKSKAEGHADLDPAKSQHERDLFWISFPYDVKLSDVFGFGDYMKHWGIMYYDGRGRAKNGFWAESETNWKFIPASKKDTILHAFEGYVLALDLDLLGESSKVWQLVEDVYLYFPSNGPAGSIVQQDTTVAIDTVGYHCNIDRYHKNDGSGGTTGLPASYDRRYRDSHWHCIGVPSFHDVSHDITSGVGEGQYWIDNEDDGVADMPNPDKFAEIADWETLEIPYFYEWNMADNKLYAKSNTASFTFKAMYSYMVQYANDHITWSAVTISPKPASVVERRKAKMADDQFREFNLHIMREDKSLDNTYVRLTDNENVTADFEFGQDMCKEFQSSSSTSIYTIIDELEVAGNSLPLSDQTTIVPVGVKIAANGLYTFSMPEGTEGIGVVLIDNIAGTRTNLGLTDYEVSLTKGKIDNRFWLEISPISQVQTGIEPISGGKDDEVRKVIVDQQMYIIRNNEIFDAQGRQVK